MDGKIKKLRKALGLMNAMILSGEEHSKQSYQAYEDAQRALDEMEVSMLNPDTLRSRYAYKPVDPSNYVTVEISNVEPLPEARAITEEEFKAGVPGFVWLDHRTGKIVFKA